MLQSLLSSLKGLQELHIFPLLASIQAVHDICQSRDLRDKTEPRLANTIQLQIHRSRILSRIFEMNIAQTLITLFLRICINFAFRSILIQAEKIIQLRIMS